MDPDKALADAVEAAEYLLTAKAADNNIDALMWGEQLAHSFNALNEWLMAGGFFPDNWGTRAS